MHFEAQHHDDELRLALRGDWRAMQLSAIETELAALPLQGLRRLTIEADGANFDVAGAWLLRDFMERAAQEHIEARIAGKPPEVLELIERTVRHEAPAPESGDRPEAELAVESIGRRAVGSFRDLVAGLEFIGRVTVALLHAITSIKRLRPTSIARHVYDTGITAVPIVSLIAFLISVILAYMGAQQLHKFGADIFVVDLVTVGVLRELGVLLTAIIIAGRSGSAFAAEIGAMRLNEEVDALHAIGVNPIEVLVLPRLLGLIIALPLLTVVADAIGLVGGGLLCHALLDMPLIQYLNRAQSAIAPTTFWVGLVKAPVFAVLIALAGCQCGMRVRGSSRDLGRLTTLAVVQAIFLVMLADALFAVLFMELDI